ncbi:hypothetical protein OPV22_017994 [Ensete ventricosum]|uniref:Secreted protein n=1 Tax=Ensete ventricosum TaxID=4639 RepID=A0AAV8QZ68_ENSVE|nr:hypothetical protein OPV22_017994 [Ensete ventricosum]
MPAPFSFHLPVDACALLCIAELVALTELSCHPFCHACSLPRLLSVVPAFSSLHLQPADLTAPTELSRRPPTRRPLFSHLDP